MGRGKTGGKYLTPEKLWDFFIAYKAEVKAMGIKKKLEIVNENFWVYGN